MLFLFFNCILLSVLVAGICEEYITGSACGANASCVWNISAPAVKGCLIPQCSSTAASQAQCTGGCVWEEGFAPKCTLTDQLACVDKIHAECSLSSGCSWHGDVASSCTATCPDAAEGEQACIGSKGCVYHEEYIQNCNPPGCGAPDYKKNVCNAREDCEWIEENMDCYKTSCYNLGQENCDENEDCNWFNSMCWGVGGCAAHSSSLDTCETFDGCFVVNATCNGDPCVNSEACACGGGSIVKTCTHADCATTPSSAADCDESTTGCVYRAGISSSCDSVCLASPLSAAECQTGCTYVQGEDASCTAPTCAGTTSDLCIATTGCVWGDSVAEVGICAEKVKSGSKGSLKSLRGVGILVLITFLILQS